MRPSKASKRGHWVWILFAGAAGFLLGSWNAEAVRSEQSSAASNAAQTIALRFPHDMLAAPIVRVAAIDARTAAVNSVMRRAEKALFDPAPMVPHQSITQAVDRSPLEDAARSAPAPLAQPAPAAAAPVAVQPKLAMAVPHLPIPRQTSRPRHLLDAAQIVSIKERLHLTPDQERMWPAVEAALRNIGAQHQQESRVRGSAGVIDPNSPEVEDLKSAAIPLLMSFSDEQKDQVRSLIHGMGLDQLASEF